MHVGPSQHGPFFLMRTPAAGRSRVAAAACVTAAAVAHARTVSNPGLFVPTVNRGVEV